jgi:hypothetical protein
MTLGIGILAIYLVTHDQGTLRAGYIMYLIATAIAGIIGGTFINLIRRKNRIK